MRFCREKVAFVSSFEKESEIPQYLSLKILVFNNLRIIILIPFIVQNLTGVFFSFKNYNKKYIYGIKFILLTIFECTVQWDYEHSQRV